MRFLTIDIIYLKLRYVWMIGLLLVAPQIALADQVTVFAAASLRDALDEVFAEESDIRLVYGGSGKLAGQIRLGAPADIFVSANEAWMNVLDEEGLISKKRPLLRNSIVLIARENNPETSLEDFSDIFEKKKDQKIAIPRVNSVPAGQYAKEALSFLNYWEEVQPYLIQTDDVRASLRLVALGEVDYGIVYRSDLFATPHVKEIYSFSELSHDPVIYSLGMFNNNPQTIYAFDRIVDAQDIFEAYGFRHYVE